MSVQIPAAAVAAGQGIPDVCSRHGGPAIERKQVKFISKPPGWAYALIIVGAIAFLIAVRVTRKTVNVPVWPFCARCRGLRKTLLASGWVTVLLSVPIFVGSTALMGQQSDLGQTAGPLGWLVGFFLFFVGLILVGRATAPAIAGAQVSRDGLLVELPNAHATFAAKAAALSRGPSGQRPSGRVPVGRAPVGPTPAPGGPTPAPPPPPVGAPAQPNGGYLGYPQIPGYVPLHGPHAPPGYAQGPPRY